MNMYKRGAVGSDCTGSVVTLPVNDDIVEEDRLAIEGKTLGYNGTVRATVNRRAWKPEAKRLSKKPIGVHRHVPLAMSWT
jgi:hypothetical protein